MTKEESLARFGGRLLPSLRQCRLAIEHYDTTQVLAGLEVGTTTIYIVEVIGLSDQFAQLQRAIAI
jgi:hypothetical protein